MAIPTITGFDISKYEPADVKQLVADQTARLALAYPYDGLLVHQQDTDQRFLYIGTPPTNTASDWLLKATWIVGAIVPTTEGVDGDMYFNNATNYLYEKVTGTWTLRADLTGAQILTGVVAPTTEGVDNDIYFLTADNGGKFAGDVFQKAAGSWGSALININGADGLDGDKYATTSTQSIDFGGVTDPLAITLVDTGLQYSIGQSVIVASRGTLTNYLTGLVEAYASPTLTLGTIVYNGTGSSTDLDVNLEGAVGARGQYGKSAVPDVVYTGAVGFIFNDIATTGTIDVVEADSQWTVDNPHIGYVTQDDRGNKQSPDGIKGDMKGHVVIYEGTPSVWIDAGKITGQDGVNGWNGWSPVLSTEYRVTNGADEEVLKISSWIGGTGSIPQILLDQIGDYLSTGGLVSSAALATNVRGAKGNTGDTPILDVFEMTSASKNINIADSKLPQPPTAYNVNLSVVQSRSLVSAQTWERSNAFVSDGTEQLYITARMYATFIDTSTSTRLIKSAVTVTLEASLGGSFITGGLYTLLTIETTTFPIVDQSANNMEIRSGYAVPTAGTWYFRIRATSLNPMNFTQNTGVIYEIFKMNKSNQPQV